MVLRKAEDPGVMQRRRKGRGYGRGVVSAAEEESEGLKNRGKGDKPGEGGSWDKGEGGPGFAGAGLGPKGRGLPAQEAAKAAQSLLLLPSQVQQDPRNYRCGAGCAWKRRKGQGWAWADLK